MFLSGSLAQRSDDVSADLWSLNDVAAVYDWIGDAIAKLNCKHICVVLQNEEISDRAIVSGLYGLNQTWILKLIDMVGFNPLRKSFAKTEEGKKFYFTETRLREFNGGLHEFSGGLISKWVSVSLERIFRIRKIYTVALNHAEIPLGSVLLFDRELLGEEQLAVIEETAAAASRRLYEIRHEKLGLGSKKNEFADALISQLNHEIRTPLNGILGLMSEVIDENRVSGSSSGIIDDLTDCADQLQRTVDNLVLNSNLCANRVNFQFQKVSEQQICECIHRIAESFKSKYPEQSIVVKSSVSSYAQFISADARYMKIALLELMDNALKFSSIDVQVRLLHEEDCLVLEIEDFGFGVSSGMVNELFNSFTRSGNQRTHYRGNGVGLSIAKQIVNAHEFELDLLETSRNGSIFALKMPYIKALSETSDWNRNL